VQTFFGEHLYSKRAQENFLYPQVKLLSEALDVYPRIKQGRSQPEFFIFFFGGGEVRANYGGTKLFCLLDENKGIKCLYRYYSRILIMTSRRWRYFWIHNRKRTRSFGVQGHTI